LESTHHDTKILQIDQLRKAIFFMSTYTVTSITYRSLFHAHFYHYDREYGYSLTSKFN